MDYSAMIYFNNYSSFRMSTYIDALKDCSNNSYLINSKMPPHITIGMWNSKDSFAIQIGEFAKKTKAFDVIFAELGIFNNRDDKGNIHLAPVKSDSITEFHKNFYETVKLNQGDEFEEIYKNTNIWVPHVTIGYGVSEGNMTKAIEKCLTINLPQKAVAQKIAVARCCPFREIAIFELSKQ